MRGDLDRKFWRWWWFGGKDLFVELRDRVYTLLVVSVIVWLVAAVTARYVGWWF